METQVKMRLDSNTIDIKKALFELRGMDVNTVNQLQNPSKDNLLDPFGLSDMGKAVNIFLSQMLSSEPTKIFIQVDSDVDGLTSAALMHNFCKLMFGEEVEIAWNMHESKQHGINLSVIPDDTNLVIIPDAGSNQYKEHKTLNDAGKYVLILDHHAVSGDEAPPVFERVALVNNQLSPNYANKALSGVGVSYKFCEAVVEQLNMSLDEEEEINIDYLMDLVAVGLIADSMVTTIPENAYYINCGLNNINNPGLMSLVEVQSYSLKNRTDLTITDVSFYIAPLINAVFRVGRPDDKRILFTAFIEGDSMVQSTKRGAETGMVEVASKQAARHASNTKKRQTTALSKALDFVETQIRQKVADNPNFMQDSKGLFIVFDEGRFPRPMTGLIAIKLMVKYNKPTFILMKNAKGYLAGSVRAEEYIHIPDFRSFCHESDKTDFAEGHPCAFGIGFEDEDHLELFKEELAAKSAGHDFAPLVTIDFEIPAKMLSEQMILDLAELVPVYGKGFAEPKLGIVNAIIPADKFNIMGADQTTVKFYVNGVSCIRFKDKEFVEKIRSALENKTDLVIDFVGRSGLNEWMGNVTPQIIIENFISVLEDYSF